jgi:hypothetical protein
MAVLFNRVYQWSTAPSWLGCSIIVSLLPPKASQTYADFLSI